DGHRSGTVLATRPRGGPRLHAAHLESSEAGTRADALHPADRPGLAVKVRGVEGLLRGRKAPAGVAQAPKGRWPSGVSVNTALRMSGVAHFRRAAGNAA